MHYLYYLTLLLVFGSCSTAPKNFSYYYHSQNTGLDALIDIGGYYVSEHGCDTSFFSVFMFYPDGLFTIATTSEISDELVECFEKGGNSSLCQYPLWGTYEVRDSIIYTQTIRPEGGGCVIFRNYKILPSKEIINISDYVEPRYTSMGYMQNYPSYKDNTCTKPSTFHTLKTKRPQTDCLLLKLKWFNPKVK